MPCGEGILGVVECGDGDWDRDGSRGGAGEIGCSGWVSR